MKDPKYDDPHRALALLASFHVDLEYSFQSLGPGRGGVAFRRSVTEKIPVLTPASFFKLS